MMKIQVVTYGVSRYSGGVLGAVSGLFTNNKFYDEDINIISFKDDMAEADRHLWGKLPIQLFRANKFLYSRKALNCLLQSDADILHMECLWRWPQRWMPIWSKYKARPIVCSPHGMLDPWIIKKQGMPKRIVAKFFFDRSLRYVDCFHALCEQELKDIRQYGIKAPVAIIPNGVDIPKEEYKQKLWRDTLKQNVRKRHLLYLGRLHPKKGIDILIESLNIIKKQHNYLLDLWHIDIVGWGDDKYVNQLKKLCRQYNLIHYISFHGEKFGEEKLKLLAQSDAYILPSHGEGLPLTVLEAWSWNLPVVMTPQCNIPQGFQYEAAIKIMDDIKSCTDGLLCLFCMSAEKLEEMGNNGFKLVKEQFCWDIAAKRMYKLYQWLLGQCEKPDFVYNSLSVGGGTLLADNAGSPLISWRTAA